MAYTKEDFKHLWEANDDGNGITFEDIANCARAWHLYLFAYCYPRNEVVKAVLQYANCI